MVLKCTPGDWRPCGDYCALDNVSDRYPIPHIHEILQNSMGNSSSLKFRGHGVFEITKQRLCNQARATGKNGWLSDLEHENIRRMIDVENEMVNESTEDVEEKYTEGGMVRTNCGYKQNGDGPDD